VSSIWRPVRERNPARSLMVVVAHPGDEAFGPPDPACAMAKK